MNRYEYHEGIYYDYIKVKIKRLTITITMKVNAQQKRMHLIFVVFLDMEDLLCIWFWKFATGKLCSKM